MFTQEQKEYLTGFFSGVQTRGLMPPLVGDRETLRDLSPQAPAADQAWGKPLDELTKEERIKHELHGLDCYDRIVEHAERDALPKDGDVFRFKFHGLFNVTPVQDKLMLRARVPGGRLTAEQLRGVAQIADDWSCGRIDLTTRANFQLREIPPRHAPEVLDRLRELGLTSKGAGADNIRNVTATPTTGFDPQELLDVMPLALRLHHTILENRDLYGLPRKFNIAFDSGGMISACADTNDIAFQAVRVPAGQAVPEGVWFRVQLCGITGHRQHASDCGIVVTPAASVAVACAMVRVFVAQGDRTDRKKARLKYLIDAWGVEKFLAATEAELGRPLRRLPLDACLPRGTIDGRAHHGAHAQSDGRHHWLGVAVPVGRLPSAQARVLADLAARYGRGELRLTVWQNLLIPHVAPEDLPPLRAALEAAGLRTAPDPLVAGLVACTGASGCKYAATHTKEHAVELAAALGAEFQLDTPLNIHVTGCPHSCAQHYVGDIGLIGQKVKVGPDTVEGYHVVLGGGVDHQRAIGREVFRNVPYPELRALLARLLAAYLERRTPGENFHQFSARHSVDELQALAERKGSET